jgi:hypothetical protein
MGNLPGDSVTTRSGRVRNARPLLWVLLAATLASHVLILWINRHSIAAGSYDFVAFYSAAQIVKSGHGESLYTIPMQRQFQQQFPSFREHPLLFNHPAFEVLIYLPLAYFSFPTAFVLWTVVNLGTLCVVLFLLFPRIQSLKESLGSPLILLLLLSFYPVTVTLLQGQDSILFLLLYCAAFAELRRGNDQRAGLFCALSMFRFQLMIPLFLAFLFRRRWKVLRGFLLGSAGLALLSVFITGWDGLVAYVRLLWGINEASRQNPANRDLYYIHPEAMPNIRGFLDAHLAGRMPDAVVLLLIASASLLLLVWSVRKGVGRHGGGQTGSDLPFALHTTVTLLITYHMHLHDVSLLLLPLLLVANHLVETPADRSPVRLGLLVLIIGFFFSPTYVLPFWYDQLNLVALPLLAFALLIAAEMARASKPAAAPA